MSNQYVKGEDLGKFYKGTQAHRDCLNYIVSCLTPEELKKATELWRQPPSPEAKAKDSYIYACWSGKYDPSNDLKVFGMYLVVDGQVVDKIPFNSGQSYAQDVVAPESDYSGSMRPLPEGIYDIGLLDDLGYDPGSQDGFGQWVYPLNPRFKMSRSALLVHCDRNRTTSPGSAGCACPYNIDAMLQFVGWMSAKNRPAMFVMDHGLGFLEKLSPGFVAPNITTLPAKK
jgi:hypothetical protein